jgi:hypothetical protein
MSSLGEVILSPISPISYLRKSYQLPWVFWASFLWETDAPILGNELGTQSWAMKPGSIA